MNPEGHGILAFIQANVSVINCKLVAHLHAYLLVQKESSEQATRESSFNIVHWNKIMKQKGCENSALISAFRN